MRNWLITGCSTGIGRAIAEYVLQAGERVVVTARNPADIADFVARFPDRALALPLDVSDAAQVSAAVAQAESWAGPVDVLVNNAGYGYVSSIEEGEEQAIKALFETNFFGALRMMQAVLPAMRAKRAGRIINISSLAGRIANPATGYYSASKFALEAVNSALAREVAEFGIHVTAIAPGMFRTDFSGRSLKANEGAISDYDAGAHARIALVRSVDGRQAGDPMRLAAAVMAVADMADPPVQLLLGPDAFNAVSARMQETLASMESHRELTIGTNFQD